MPDKTGKLGKDDEAAIAKWFAKYPDANWNCPICGKNDWSLAEDIVSPMALGSDHFPKMSRDASVYPHIMLISPCGYTMHLNAITIGIVKSGDNNKE